MKQKPLAWAEVPLRTRVLAFFRWPSARRKVIAAKYLTWVIAKNETAIVAEAQDRFYQALVYGSAYRGEDLSYGWYSKKE